LLHSIQFILFASGELTSMPFYQPWWSKNARPWLILFLLAFSYRILASEAKTPERKVHEDVLTSDHDPQIRIVLPATSHYLGADRWILGGFDDCELHAFVDADQQKTVQRLYWVQFESYLPSRPNMHHTYDSPRHAEMAGMDFYVDTWPRATNTKTEAGSDLGHLELLIHSKGYNLPTEMIYARFVHLLDQEKRKELMIIYAENLAPTGLTAADLLKGGKDFRRWPTLERDLIDRAEQNIKLHTPSEP
jgi:hypothetical protein